MKTKFSVARCCCDCDTICLTGVDRFYFEGDEYITEDTPIAYHIRLSASDLTPYILNTLAGPNGMFSGSPHHSGLGIYRFRSIGGGFGPAWFALYFGAVPNPPYDGEFSSLTLNYIKSYRNTSPPSYRTDAEYVGTNYTLTPIDYDVADVDGGFEQDGTLAGWIKFLYDDPSKDPVQINGDYIDLNYNPTPYAGTVVDGISRAVRLDALALIDSSTHEVTVGRFATDFQMYFSERAGSPDPALSVGGVHPGYDGYSFGTQNVWNQYVPSRYWFTVPLGWAQFTTFDISETTVPAPGDKLKVVKTKYYDADCNPRHLYRCYVNSQLIVEASVGYQTFPAINRYYRQFHGFGSSSGTGLGVPKTQSSFKDYKFSGAACVEDE